MFLHLLPRRGVFQGQGIRGRGCGLWLSKRCVVTHTRVWCYGDRMWQKQRARGQ